MKEVKILVENEFESFDSSMLEVGEMMKSNDVNAKGHVILKTFDGLASLTDPNRTWEDSVRLGGRKLEPGTQVLLTA